MKKTKLFDINYLINEEYTEDDLHFLCDTPGLLYSLIKYEFELIGLKKNLTELRKITKQKGWQYKYFWTDKQIEEFEKNTAVVFRKLYYINNTEALSNAQMFVINYGLSNERIKNSKYDNKL